MFDQELDEGLLSLPASDATAQIGVERDRALEDPRRNASMPEATRAHQRAPDYSSLIGSAFVAALFARARFVEPGANRLVIAECREDQKGARQCILSREQV